MKTIRFDRKKSFYEFLNNSKDVVADEMISTSDAEFFKNMSYEDMMKWATESINFVIEDLGLTDKGNKRKRRITVDQKQTVYYSQKYADKQKRDRQAVIEKAKDLIKKSSFIY